MVVFIILAFVITLAIIGDVDNRPPILSEPITKKSYTSPGQNAPLHMTIFKVVGVSLCRYFGIY